MKNYTFNPISILKDKLLTILLESSTLAQLNNNEIEELRQDCVNNNIDDLFNHVETAKKYHDSKKNSCLDKKINFFLTSCDYKCIGKTYIPYNISAIHDKQIIQEYIGFMFLSLLLNLKHKEPLAILLHRPIYFLNDPTEFGKAY